MPAAAFIGSFRGPKADGDLALPGLSAPVRVLRALTPFMGGFDVEFFASMRLAADMGDDEKIEAVLAGGVVDRQFHPHQKDQLPAWSEGRLLPWWFAPQQVEAHAQKRQQLVPR
jgi:penicillin amidase